MMPSVRPVLAMFIGSQSADSISTSVVFSSQPECSPPMTPPIDSIAFSSDMTTLLGPSLYSRWSSASTVSPSLARRTVRLPLTLAASKTCIGRPWSKVM
ncbi:hypothetical protein D9M72_543020 [compost metagenome]